MTQQDPNMSSREAYNDIKERYKNLHEAYKKYFPKVDSKLIQDLLLHSISFDKNKRLYSIQVLAKEGTDSEKARNFFWEKTGKVPQAYEKGTHYLVNIKVTFDLLLEMQSYDEVEKILGGYVGPTSTVQDVYAHRGEDEQSRLAND